MPIYVYQGIRRSDGKAVKGLKDAEGEKNLRAALKREGILITSVEEKGEGRSRGEGTSEVQRLSPVPTKCRMTKHRETLSKCWGSRRRPSRVCDWALRMSSCTRSGFRMPWS